MVRQLFLTDAADELDPDDVYAALAFPEGVGGRPYVVVNMVSTADGKAALGGSAAGIGSRTDARLMRQIRAAVDAVMHGAGTLRAEIVDPRVDPPRVEQRIRQGLEAQPLAVAVSGSLDLEPSNRFFVNGPERTVILTSPGATAGRRARLAPYAQLIEEGDGLGAVDLTASLRRLYDAYGVRRLLAEGGPTLNQRLLDAGLVDEMFWTVAPKLAGGGGRATFGGDEPTTRIKARLELVSLFEHAGELFTRYRLRRGGDGSYRP
jgi:riboflavin-specific deaminase-like protein